MVRGLLLVGPGVLQRVGHPAMRPVAHLPAGFGTAIYTPGWYKRSGFRAALWALPRDRLGGQVAVAGDWAARILERWRKYSIALFFRPFVSEFSFGVAKTDTRF